MTFTPINSVFAQAIQSHQDGDLLRAQSHCQEILGSNPDHPESLRLLALVCQQQGDLEKAISAFQQLNQLRPENPLILLKLANFLLKTNQENEALSCLSQLKLVSQQQPDSTLEAMEWVEAAELMMRIGALEGAVLFFQGAKQVNPVLEESDIGLYRLQRFQEQLGLALKPPKQSNLPDTHWDCFIFSPSTVNGQGGGQHPPQIARALTELGHHVLFVQPLMLEAQEEAFSVYQDIFLSDEDRLTDFQTKRYQELAHMFCQQDVRHRVALFTVFTPYLLQLIPLLKSCHFKIVYWCLDDWQHIGDPRLTLALETQFAKEVDSLFATSRLLSEKMMRLSGKPCPVIANGFSTQNFPPVTALPAVPDDMEVGDVKTFIYWGDLISPWVNWPLFIDIAKQNPQWTFNLIGRLYENFDEFRYLFPENCHFLGQKRVDELQAYGYHADIAFIHFVNSPLIQAVNPVKAYEYLACGLPIISTYIPEIKDFPATYLIENADEFREAVNKIEQCPMDKNQVETFLAQTSWMARANRFIECLQES